MIKKQFTASARRARNIIWNAAGRYDFEPAFMAFFPNGAPDHYFDMVVGFTEKWLDMEKISAFFERYAYDRRVAEFDEFLWLGLENCVYEKEVAERPILEALRRERAERFFREQENLSRQQMEYQSMSVYTQQQARWSAVLGRRAPLRTPREKRMSEALLFPGTLDTDAVIGAMESFLKTFFRFESGPVPAQRAAGTLAKLLLRHEHRRRDRLLVRTGTGEGDLADAQRRAGADHGRRLGAAVKVLRPPRKTRPISARYSAEARSPTPNGARWKTICASTPTPTAACGSPKGRRRT